MKNEKQSGRCPLFSCPEIRFAGRRGRAVLVPDSSRQWVAGDSCVFALKLFDCIFRIFGHINFKY